MIFLICVKYQLYILEHCYKKQDKFDNYHSLFHSRLARSAISPLMWEMLRFSHLDSSPVATAFLAKIPEAHFDRPPISNPSQLY